MSPTREEQKRNRYEQILMAGLDQFIRRGYAGAKIADIARAAGMSTGLLFHYFPSKEALYIELIRLGVEAPQELAGGIETADALGFFRVCAEQTLMLAGQSAFTAKMFVLMNSAYFSEDIPGEAREKALTQNFYAGLSPLIALGQKQGTIREGDPATLCMTFWAAIQGAVQAYAMTPGTKLPEPEWIVDILRKKEEN